MNQIYSKAPKPEPLETNRLWEEFAKNRSLETRNQLVMHYIYLVKVIVTRLMPTYKRHVDFDDLMSNGLLGLMDAIDKFDQKKEVKFETYATLRVKGEIVDQIRKQDWAPISLRQKIKKVEEGYEALETALGRVPSEQEVADHISLNVEEVKKALDESHTFNLVALDEMLMDRVGSERMLASDNENPEVNLEERELKNILASFIDTLPEKEKLVISLYYNDELTLKEIGAVLGVSEARVSQIHSKTLMTLRLKMKKALDE